jgi:AraC-like DNA-binding protein
VETGLPINEISRTVGFEDELYFSRCFRRAMSLSPRAYRQAHPVIPH